MLTTVQYKILHLYNKLYHTESINLPVPLYGCETSSFTTRKQYVRENNRPKRGKVTEEWRKMHKDMTRSFTVCALPPILLG
jgi:hypothetical protein